MQSKTPTFDAALDEIFKTLVPHVRECRQKGMSKYCEKKFEITKEDIEFLMVLRVPPPHLCPTCRHQRRLSFTNYSRIFKRKCEVPGHDEILISIIPPVSPWIVYDDKVYLSDEWDARDYAASYEAKNPFLTQVYDLKKKIPHAGAPHGAEVINSDYTFYGRYIRDSYFAFGAYSSEEICYSGAVFDSHHIFDCYNINSGEMLYECIGCNKCVRVFFSYFSRECIDSYFLYDCANCMDCFGCVNLRNKRYCWFNEQLNKEEYEKRRKEADLGDPEATKKIRTQFFDFIKKYPVRAERFEGSVDVTGNDIVHSKNIYNGFQIENAEHFRHVHFIKGAKDGMDMTYGSKSELSYETTGVGVGSFRTHFSVNCKTVSDCEYSINCTNSQNCFGCIGLKNVSYAIMNKIYEPDEYFKRLDELKTEMLKREEYGEMFSMDFSPYAYNTSIAEMIYPMTKDEMAPFGLPYQDDVESSTQGLLIVEKKEREQSVQNFSAEILSKAFLSEISGKPFRLIDRELTFHKRYNFALPTETPVERMTRRMHESGIKRMTEEMCFSCGTLINSQYKSSDGWRPYCSACYQKEVV